MIRPGVGKRLVWTYEEAAMSRTKSSHQLIDHAAEQANALVDQAATQAAALVDQMSPHVDAARERLVTEYVPQAKKAGRKARKQLVEEYVPQARAAFEDARDAAGQALTAAAVKSPLPTKPEPKRRGRTVLKVLAVAGVGAAVAARLRRRNISPASMYEAPAPQADQPVTPPVTPSAASSPPPAAVTPAAPQSVGPVPPGAVGEPNPETEDLLDEEQTSPSR